MRKQNGVELTTIQTKALEELKKKLKSKYDIENLILYGSVARGEYDDESDIDILVITSQSLPRRIRHGITDIVFDMNLNYETNFSTLVVDKDSWETGPYSILPIREDIIKEGVVI